MKRSDRRCVCCGRSRGFIYAGPAYFHCQDGAAFLGVVGRAELEPYPDALEMLRHEHDEYGWSERGIFRSVLTYGSYRPTGQDT